MPRLSIDISPEDHPKLKAIAALEGQSITDYVLGRALGDAPAPDGCQKHFVLWVFIDRPNIIAVLHDKMDVVTRLTDRI